MTLEPPNPDSTPSDSDTLDGLSEQVRAVAAWALAHHDLIALLEQRLDERDQRIGALEVSLDRLWMFRPRDAWPYPKQVLPDRHRSNGDTKQGITAALPEFQENSGAA